MGATISSLSIDLEDSKDNYASMYQLDRATKLEHPRLIQAFFFFLFVQSSRNPSLREGTFLFAGRSWAAEISGMDTL